MDFRKFQQDLHIWQVNTFPQSDVHAKLSHLKQEIAELEENPSDVMEMADIVILVTGLAAIQGYDLSNAIEQKFEINKTRKWGTPDKNGVVNHIE
jgi:hypothetical protein